MTKIAIITDIHFHARNSQYFHDNLFMFLENTFFPYLEENAIKTVLILGDTFDKRKNVDFNNLHDVRQRFFDRLENLGIEVKIIYGNHDVYFKNTNDVNSIDLLLGGYKNIEIVDTHKVFEFDELKIGMISWINPSNLIESLNWIKTVSVDVLCGHFEINGFEMVKGHTCENGLKAYIFDRFEKVISGHFHVISDDGRIHYIGNPNQTSWGDYGLDKGFHVLDTTTRELTLIKNEFHCYEKFEFTDDSIDIVKFDYEVFRNKIVRLYADLSNLTLKRKLDLFLDKVQEVSFTCDVHNLSQNKEIIKNTMIDVTEIKEGNTLDLINKYIDEMATDNIDKNKLTDKFKWLYSKAMEQTTEGVN